VSKGSMVDLSVFWFAKPAKKLSSLTTVMSEVAAIMGREGTMSLGTYFTMVREKSGLSIEKVSSETHIGAQRLREIERDDFSNFAHPSYARMYAIDYARYLGIPVSRIRRLLPEAGGSGEGAYQYLKEKPCDYMRTDFGSPGRRRRLLSKLAAAGILILLGLGGFKFWVTLRDIERLGLNRVASGDTAALAFQGLENSVPSTPESATGDSAGAKHEETGPPSAASPVRRDVPSDAGSPALLVGADLDQSNRIR
jgi:cytoskeletal protein RodZ